MGVRLDYEIAARYNILRVFSQAFHTFAAQVTDSIPGVGVGQIGRENSVLEKGPRAASHTDIENDSIEQLNAWSTNKRLKKQENMKCKNLNASGFEPVHQQPKRERKANALLTEPCRPLEGCAEKFASIRREKGSDRNSAF